MRLGRRTWAVYHWRVSVTGGCAASPLVLASIFPLKVVYNRDFILQLQRELTTRRVEGTEGNSGHKGVFSPQDVAPRSPHPCTSTPIPASSARSHSDSEAMLEEQGAVMRLKGPTENLFLDALSLDPLFGLEVPPPSRLESEKKFPCMKEVTPALGLIIAPYFGVFFEKQSITTHHERDGRNISTLSSLNRLLG